MASTRKPLLYKKDFFLFVEKEYRKIMLSLRKVTCGSNKGKDTSKSFAVNMDLAARSRLVQSKLFTCHDFLWKKM